MLSSLVSRKRSVMQNILTEIVWKEGCRWRVGEKGSNLSVSRCDLRRVMCGEGERTESEMRDGDSLYQTPPRKGSEGMDVDACVGWYVPVLGWYLL